MNRNVLPVLLVLLGFFGLATAAWLLNGEETYTIADGDQVVAVSGEYDTVHEVVQAAEITLRREDRTIPPRQAAAVPDTPIRVQRARAVRLTVDGEQRTLWTQQTTLGAFLQESGVALRPANQVQADGRSIAVTAVENAPLPERVAVQRLLDVVIDDGQEQRPLRTDAQTVGAALQEAGITLGDGEAVEPPADTLLAPEMVITVQRTVPVTIVVDGRTLQVRTAHTQPLDVLAENGIGLVGQDYTQPAADATLQPGATLRVVRVTEEVLISDAEILFQTAYQPSDQLDLDTKAVLSAGAPGIQRTRTRVRYEDGVEVGRTVEGEWRAREPVNQVIGYGTRITLGVVETPEGPREYWRVVRMRATAYTAASAGKSPDHPNYGITASGRPAGTGIVAIDPNVVPFRSEVFVPGYGVGFAGDTGGGVKGRWIDLGYDEDELVAWNGYVDVYYLTPIPADINYLLPDVLP